MDDVDVSAEEDCGEVKHLDLHPIAYLACKLWVSDAIFSVAKPPTWSHTVRITAYH